MKNAFIVIGGLLGLLVAALIVGTTYFGVSSPAGSRQITSPSVVANTLKTITGTDRRRKFAYEMEVNSSEIAPTLTNARYTVEGEQATTLVITSDGISPADCWDLQKGTHGQSAASIGFTMLTCRNPGSRGEWELPLSQ